MAGACALGGQCSSRPPEPGRACPFTHLVNPELAHDDVVHSGGDFPPDIVIPTGVELQVDGACGESNNMRSAGRDIPQSPPPPTVLILRAIPLPASPNQVWLWIHPSLSLLQKGRLQLLLPSVKNSHVKSRSEMCCLVESGTGTTLGMLPSLGTGKRKMKCWKEAAYCT